MSFQVIFNKILFIWSVNRKYHLYTVFSHICNICWYRQSLMSRKHYHYLFVQWGKCPKKTKQVKVMTSHFTLCFLYFVLEMKPSTPPGFSASRLFRLKQSCKCNGVDYICKTVIMCHRGWCRTSVNKGWDTEHVFKNPELSARRWQRAALEAGDFGRHTQGQSLLVMRNVRSLFFFPNNFFLFKSNLLRYREHKILLFLSIHFNEF